LSTPSLALPQVRVKPPTLREASFDDYDQIASLENSVGLTSRPRERWLHLWRNNPAFQLTADWPIGWVLEDEEGRIVGSIGNIPLQYHLQGRIHLAATFIGWAVDPLYRAFSLLLVAHRHQHRRVELQMVTTAGPMPQAVFTKLGWSRVPVGQWDQAAFWITSYAGAADGYLQRKLPGVAASLVRSLVAAPLLVIDSVARRKQSFGADSELEWRSDFDASFDEFWSALQTNRRSLLLASRAGDMLNWHFEHSLKSNDAWILTARKGARLIGYAVLQRRDSVSRGLTRMMLVDFQTLVPEPILASAMMSAALARCRREDIHILENLGCWIDKLQPLANRPTNRRSLESWCYLYKCTNKELAKSLETAESWYPTLYDGDATL
jgi:hypothetical protein